MLEGQGLQHTAIPPSRDEARSSNPLVLPGESIMIPYYQNLVAVPAGGRKSMPFYMRHGEGSSFLSYWSKEKGLY